MPGLVGIAGSERASRESVIGAMRDMLAHSPEHVRGAVYSDASISAARVRLSSAPADAEPAQSADILVWLDGEILRCDGEDASPVLTAADIARHFAVHREWSFLRRLYGTFAGVLYDRASGAVHLFTDRFGFRFLYLARTSNGIAWGSETKAFLTLPGFDRTIDPVAVQQFLSIGYLLADRTLLAGARMVPPASVLSWRDGELTTHRYWHWSEIPARDVALNDAGAEELAEILEGALSAACAPPGRVGLTLSGGLDSRAILAQAERSIGSGVPAVTFGEPHSDDVALASRVARVAHARHSVVQIGTANWLEPRLAGVWMTDGHLDLMHMHGIEARDALRSEMDVAINGFAGDIVLGGGFMDPARSDSGLDPTHIARLLRLPVDQLEGIERFTGLRHSDYYMLENRLRRFTGAGLHLAQSSVEQRRPFFDPRLVDFAYGLPDDVRRRSRLYKRALLRQYPDFFRTIPWQKTGVTIRRSERVEDLSILVHKLRHRLGSHLPIARRRSWTIVDYPRYLRNPATRAFLERLLLSHDTRLTATVDVDRMRDALASHMAGENRAPELCRMLTLELWLRQMTDVSWRSVLGETPVAARELFAETDARRS